MTYEEAIVAWRRSAREVEHKRAQHTLMHPELSAENREAHFIVHYKEALDTLSALATDVDVHRIRMEDRVATSVETFYSTITNRADMTSSR